MTKIAVKLAELHQRAEDLESKIALQTQQAAFLQEHGRSHAAPDVSVAAMQKLLSSIRRSCQILAQHV